jgi:Tfp pilus assembly PilM family ATPase
MVEDNVVNRSIDSIEQELAKTLELYMGKADEVEIEKELPPSIGDIDLDEVLGKDESGTTEEG